VLHFCLFFSLFHAPGLQLAPFIHPAEIASSFSHWDFSKQVVVNKELFSRFAAQSHKIVTKISLLWSSTTMEESKLND